jgi:TPP-dependent pyruvate/acetoin dehydrogenase alpha subunit
MELHVKVHYMKLQHGNAVEITSSFIVENNGYAMGTSVERTANHTDIWKLGLGYEMPCGPVDG